MKLIALVGAFALIGLCCGIQVQMSGSPGVDFEVNCAGLSMSDKVTVNGQTINGWDNHTMPDGSMVSTLYVWDQLIYQQVHSWPNGTAVTTLTEPVPDFIKISDSLTNITNG